MVWKRALGVYFFALLWSSNFSDLSSQVKLNSWAQGINNGQTLRSFLRQERFEHSLILQGCSEIFRDKLLNWANKGRIGADMADKSLSTVVIVFKGSLKHNLFDLDGVIIGTFNRPAITTVTPVPIPMLGIGKEITNLEANKCTDQKAVHNSGRDGG